MGLDAPRTLATMRSRRRLSEWIVDSLLRETGGGLAKPPVLTEETPDDGRKYHDGPPHKWRKPSGEDMLGVA